MAKFNTPPETYLDLMFPSLGIDETQPYGNQRRGTCIDAQNVRAFDPVTGRERGGSRPGLTRYFSATVNGDYSIQEITHLVTNDAIGTESGGQFVYAMAAGAGFGVADTDGVSLEVYDALASYEFTTSCWDDDGFLYVARVNSTTGATRIQKVNLTTETIVWTQTAIAVATGSIRNVNGICVIGAHVYVACTTAAATCTIHRLSVATGGVVTGNWRATTGVAGAELTFAVLIFSTGASNCLGKCGNVLGIECRSHTTTQGLLMIDVTAATTVTPKYYAYGGTAQNNRAAVVGDGISAFYVLASVTTGLVKKVSLGGTLIWSSTAADTAQGIAFDPSKGVVVAVVTSAPSLVSFRASDGANTASHAAGAITAWHAVDSDHNGQLILWRNAQASNDVMGVSITSALGAAIPTFATGFGPVTLANTTHSGASANRGLAFVLPATSSRQIRGLVFADGECRRFDEDGTTAITDGAAFNPNIPAIFTAQNGLDMFIVDGSVYRYYESATDSIQTWTADFGDMPLDDFGAPGRLICTWRGRTVIAGLPRDPHNWFMSAVDDPWDWDYSPTTESETQAVSGNISPAGLLGGTINCIIPFNDDLLIFGLDHEIWQMTGDPMSGGRFDLVSDLIGIAWGKPFAKDPFGRVYFFSTECGVYMMAPGNQPVYISQQIQKRLDETNLGTHLVRMVWDTRMRGLHVFISPIDKRQPATHWFYEERTQAWQADVFGDVDYNPVAVHAFDGDDPNDRTILLGGRDGHVRALSLSAEDDDGTEIESYVWIGPIMIREHYEAFVKSLQAILGEESGDVDYAVHVGETAQRAFESDAFDTGTWDASRNPVTPLNAAGHAVYVKLSSTNRWAMETIQACLRNTGRVRARG
jgi:hypothetical protein